MAKSLICLWFDGTAENAARFYAQTFPDSAVTAVHRAPGDFPNGKAGQVLTVAVDDFQRVGKYDLLIQIDPADYQAQVDQAEATVIGAQAALDNPSNRVELARCDDRAGRSRPHLRESPGR